MQIAVTAQGPDLESPVDPRFGRAAYFLLIETETLDWTVMENQDGHQAHQGAGVQAAQKIAGAGAEALLTGHCGPKAHQLLVSAGVKIYNNAEGTVRQAIEQFQDGKLVPTAEPDVEGHWQ